MEHQRPGNWPKWGFGGPADRRWGLYRSDDLTNVSSVDPFGGHPGHLRGHMGDIAVNSGEFEPCFGQKIALETPCVLCLGDKTKKM